MIIDKNKFVKIMNRLKNYNELQNKINKLFKNLIDNQEQDFCNAGSICIGHESVVISLLEDMFETDLISYWIYEENFGRNFKMGDISENDIDIDISTADKLYDFLIKELERKQKNEKI